MYAYLLASLLSMPLYPINPSVQDTVASTNLHFTVGFNGPNRVAALSPEFTVKYEWLFSHPLIFRISSGYTRSTVNSKFYPNGIMHSYSFAPEILAYRGTSKLMAFVGLGPMLTVGSLDVFNDVADSLKKNLNLTNVKVKPGYGYRLTFGLRYHRAFSLELSLSRSTASFTYRQTISQSNFAVQDDDARISDMRMTIGYLLPVWGL